MARPAKTALDYRQKRFCELYVINFNLAESWLGAGYDCKSSMCAIQSGSRFLSNNIYAGPYIEKLLTDQKERSDKSADDIIREMERVGFANIEDFVSTNEDGEFVFTDWNRLSRGQLAAVESVKVTQTTTKNKSSDNEYTTRNVQFKLYSKLTALENLAKRFNVFPAKVEVEHGVAPQSMADIAAILASKPKLIESRVIGETDV